MCDTLPRMDSSLAKPPPYSAKRKALEASNSSLNASLGLAAAAGRLPAGGEAAQGTKRPPEAQPLPGRKTPSKVGSVWRP